MVAKRQEVCHFLISGIQPTVEDEWFPHCIEPVLEMESGIAGEDRTSSVGCLTTLPWISLR